MWTPSGAPTEVKSFPSAVVGETLNVYIVEGGCSCCHLEGVNDSANLSFKTAQNKKEII